MNERMVIVGAGQAGLQIAESLRAEGFGGAIELLAGEKLPPYQRPPLSKAWLQGDLTATGWAHDGTIEVCEDPTAPFVLGVQWHPEELPDPRIFDAFVAASTGAR